MNLSNSCWLCVVVLLVAVFDDFSLSMLINDITEYENAVIKPRIISLLSFVAFSMFVFIS